MKDTTKRTLKNTFASLISNEAAIDGAKTAPWWIAIILFILGTFLPIIPIMVNNSKTYGASFMAKDTFGFEQALATVSNEMKIDSYALTVNDDHQLIATKDSVALENTWEDDKDLTPIAAYDAFLKNDGGEDLYYRALNVFYTDRPFSKKGAKSVKDLRKTIESQQYYFGVKEELAGVNSSVELPDADAEYVSGKSKHMPSYIIFYKDGVLARIYKYASTSAYSSSYEGSDWKKIDAGTELLEKTITVEGYETVAFEEKIEKTDYVNSVKANWSKIFNKTYSNQKVKTFWFSSGLYYGIYILLGFFMGLLMWLLTRGKNNPNRNINLLIGIKISMWIDFTPGLLAMILGFIWSPSAGIAYIALIGIRTMWLSMRQLNPTVA